MNWPTRGRFFLDEINSMDLSVQSKLLKALEEKQVRRLGGEKNIEVDIRIISAMNISPFDALESGILRKDLFYRLGVVQMEIPPLRKRKGDIQLLTAHFIRSFNRKMNKNIGGLNEITMDIFNNYSWPGNVRELKNAIEYAFNLSEGDFIQLSDIPDYILTHQNPAPPQGRPRTAGGTLREQVQEFEREIIKQALETHRTQIQAAEALGITRQTLQYKIAKYKL